jgi:acyl-[acyl-carrier-protein]-phospholipid O-acyltransferase/long-chain-fatty-acid--[acyl-carrier-protein] ligase
MFDGFRDIRYKLTFPGISMKQQLSETLASRTFIGLLLAQFTATFNDQAIHVVAIFYSVDMLVRYAHVKSIDDKAVVAIVTACFITPFLLFSSYAGPLGDRFSKRSVVVFWKSAEVLMMGLAFLGLGLPHLFGAGHPNLPTIAVWSSALVIAVVFLMGMHSTFFVPAKLGAMPEILHPGVLSRGNGVLEGTSFTAQILGTSAGGILYALLKGDLIGGKLILGQEWMIGALLFVLALFGTISAFLMKPIPAAAPDLKLSFHWWRPLHENLSILWKSKPLILSVTGIALCVFITLFLRQTLFYQAEVTKELRVAQADLALLQHEPTADHLSTHLDRFLVRVLPPRLEKAAQEPELRVALLFAVVGLGIGLGSVVAGYVSGHRIELGLVPVGAVTIVICTIIPCLLRRAPGTFVIMLFGIGCGAGFYLVPLYTLLQHRAPKQAKGNVVSASNFLNVVGGIIAVAVFFTMTFGFERVMAPQAGKRPAVADAAVLQRHIDELNRQRQIPQLLFGITSVMTFGSLLLLVHRLPDFYLRTGIWLRARGHNPLRTVGIEHMPTDGPVLLLANCHVFPAALDLVAGVDRYVRLVYVADRGAVRSRLQKWAEHAGMISVPAVPEAPEWARAERKGEAALRAGKMVALTVNQSACAAVVSRLIEAWRAAVPDVVVLPVFCSSASGAAPVSPRVDPRIIIGAGLAATVPLDSVLAAIARLADATEE